MRNRNMRRNLVNNFRILHETNRRIRLISDFEAALG